MFQVPKVGYANNRAAVSDPNVEYALK